MRKIIYLNICSQILIYVNSLNEEYSKHFIIKAAKSEEEKEKIKQLRELLKPVFKKIKQWKDIDRYRNYILAHSLRVRENGHKTIFMLQGLSGYNIPERGEDYEFLVNCTNLIKESVYKVFENEYISVERKIDSDDKTDKAFLPQRDYTEEYREMVNEMIEIKKKIEARVS